MKKLILAITAILIPQLSFAQSREMLPYCNTGESAVSDAVMDALYGDWTLIHNAGYVRVGVMTLPYPGSAPETLMIFPGEGNTIWAVNAEMTDKMELVQTYEDPWRFRNDRPETAGVNPVLTDEDIGVLAGCDANALPRLIGTATFVIPGQGEMDLYAQFILIDEGVMFGILEFTGDAQGQPFLSRRSVSMTK